MSTDEYKNSAEPQAEVEDVEPESSEALEAGEATGPLEPTQPRKCALLKVRAHPL